MKFNRETKLSLNLNVHAPVRPHAGGGRANAVQLDYGFTPIFDAESPGDSLALPDAKAGRFVMLFACSFFTNPAAVFPKYGTSDYINEVQNDPIDWSSDASGLVPGNVLIFTCAVDGQWYSNGQLD